MFALSRTGLPLDNRPQRFVPDVLEKIPYGIFFFVDRLHRIHRLDVSICVICGVASS
jgi:hypothetical protein